MFKNNTNLLIAALIAIVNALGYAIIIPILYSYSQKFGLNAFQNGLLFSTFSVCQFIATPIIGRLSDKYGRKPLLLLSITGTAASFFMMAFAPSVLFLFLARALDGITAGNFPVLSAIISDTTEAKDRARGFGLIYGAFGLGFIFGPTIAALTVGFGTHIPFIIAGIVTVIAVIITAILLPETNKHKGITRGGKLFDFKRLGKALFDPNVGLTLLASLIYTLAFSIFITVFQPFAQDILKMTPKMLAINFTIFGIVGFITQMIIMPKVIIHLGDKKGLTSAFGIVALSFLAMFLFRSIGAFLLISVVYGFANSFPNPLISALLSKEADEKSQGEIMGVNASYVSVGMILGPIIGGWVSTRGPSLPFLLSSFIGVACYLLALKILKKPHPQPVHL